MEREPISGAFRESISEAFWGSVEAGSASKTMVMEEVLAQRIPSAPMKQAVNRVAEKISGLLSDFFDEEFKRFGGRLASALFSGGKVIVSGTIEQGEWKVELAITYPFVPGLVMWKMDRVTDVPWRAVVTGPGIEAEERVGAIPLSATSVVTLDDFVDALGLGRSVGAALKTSKALGAGE